MAYATKQDLLDRFGERELMGAAGTGTRDSRELDQDRIDQALADADAEIDGYLARRYQVPVTPTPVRLKAIACTLARYNLRHRNEGGGNVSDTVRDRYKDAITELDKISSGKVLLDGALPQGSPSSGSVRFTSPPSLFAGSGNGLKGW